MVTRNGIFILALVVMVWMASSCGGSGGRVTPQPSVKGSIKGTFVVNNLLPEGASYLAELFAKGASSATSSQALTVEDDKLSFDFGNLSLGTYFIKLKATVDDNTFTLNQTGDLVIDSDSPDLASESESAIGVNGTLSGAIQTEGDFPADLLVYVAARRTDITLTPGPPDGLNSVTIDVAEGDLSHGEVLFYNFENLSFGIYEVSFEGYNPATHEVDVFGAYDGSVMVDSEERSPAGVNFSAGFEGGPPPPPAGTIRGTLSFTGEPNWNLSIFIAANTIPPQAGSPPAVVEITEGTYNPEGMSYELASLPDGEYSVSIFAYNIDTHVVSYFGWYDEGGVNTVTLTAENTVVEAIDFAADWSLI